MSPITIANYILSSLTVAAQAIIVFLFAAVLLKNGKILKFGVKYGLTFAFIVALTAISGSLFYSEIAGIEPCKLCWFQRIVVYPQFILLGIALWRKVKPSTNTIPYLKEGETPHRMTPANVPSTEENTYHSGAGDKNIAPYSMALAALGIIIAGYHYLLQIGAAPAVACPVVGFSVSCNQAFTMNFGYITIPLMSFTASLFVFSFMLISKKRIMP